jgi:class 3 adenylate cyclase
MGASPSAAAALTRMNAEIDVRHILPTIRVPTLVLHRVGDRCLLVEEGRYVASLIPDARFVELPGDDHLPFVGDQDALLDAIEQFLRPARDRPAGTRILATVLCGDVDARRQHGSASALVERVHRHAVELAPAYGGAAVGMVDGQIVMVFDGPARGIRCAKALAVDARRKNVPLRLGLHTGECDMVGGTPRGLVVAISGRVARLARGGEVLVTRTVVDLVAGSGLRFANRGTHRLMQGRDGWGVYSVRES